MYLFTTIPFLYFLKTRLKGKVQRISWLFVYFIPSFVLFNFFAPLDEFKNILLLVIGITLINYIYENGYIQNDVKTTKKEKNPTLRLSVENMRYVDKNWLKIILIRTTIIIFLISLFYFISSDLKQTINLFIISLFLQILYLIYNNIRNIWNLILILPINYIRFYGFILPFIISEYLIEFIVITTLLYPLTKVLEFARQSRYNLIKISKFVGNVDIFRVKYYLVLVIFSLFLFIQTREYFYFFLISIYYLFFRICTLYLMTKSKRVQEELLENTKGVYRK